MSSKLVVVGGHGKVALHLARIASQNGHAVTSVIRDPSQSQDITDTGAKPHVLSLEDAPVSDFAQLFTGANSIVFAAGAGGKGGEERTRAVDYAGALKVFDAIDAVSGAKPRLVLVSGLDVGNEDRFPDHYVRRSPNPSFLSNSSEDRGRQGNRQKDTQRHSSLVQMEIRGRKGPRQTHLVPMVHPPPRRSRRHPRRRNRRDRSHPPKEIHFGQSRLACPVCAPSAPCLTPYRHPPAPALDSPNLPLPTFRPASHLLHTLTRSTLTA